MINRIGEAKIHISAAQIFGYLFSIFSNIYLVNYLIYLQEVKQIKTHLLKI